MVPNLAFVGALVVDSRRSKFHVADPTIVFKRILLQKYSCAYIDGFPKFDNAFASPLCLKLFRHNWHKPTQYLISAIIQKIVGFPRSGTLLEVS